MTDAAIIKYQISVLVRLVAGMFAVAGLVPGGPALSAMPDGVRRQILRVLQPAESALRRVIFIAARKVKVSGAGKAEALCRVNSERNRIE